ncbi:MAG: endolytic transglycosylase MltG [Candidatus Magasanikbacteria bacterium]|nr:endolytic transglycosylase MltG [Candidatus Magasanikbacteria bacterium]
MKKIYFFSAIVILLAVVSGYIFYRLYFVSPVENAPIVQFEITEGQSLPIIIKNLQMQKLLVNPRLFKWYFIKNGLDKKIQTGIFEIQPGLSVKKLAGIITNPETVEIKLTFLEGWNLRDYGHYLEGLGLFQAEELHELVGFPAVDFRQLLNQPTFVKKPFDNIDFLQNKPQYATLEGYLFPDTYFFKKHATIKQIVEKMLENFGQKLSTELRTEIKRQKKDIFEIVTVASLLEAEAREEKDRRMIADIIWRRLDLGMPLQLDSTVNYVTGGKKPAISSAEQLIDSPYNTYKYAGLPLGPINNPGLESIRAAIYPEKNDYWYFLSGQDGIMRYAKNLSGHNENKNKYLK